MVEKHTKEIVEILDNLSIDERDRILIALRDIPTRTISEILNETNRKVERAYSTSKTALAWSITFGLTAMSMSLSYAAFKADNITSIISGAVGFGVGALVGGIIAMFFDGNIKLRENWERTFIAIAVTMVWIGSTIVSWSGQYDMPNGVTTIMGIVAGFFFGGSIINKLRK